MSRQTPTHEKHLDHLGEHRWHVEVLWETEDPVGEWTRHSEYCGDFGSQAEAIKVGEQQYGRHKEGRLWLTVEVRTCTWVEDRFYDERRAEMIFDAELEIDDLAMELTEKGWSR